MAALTASQGTWRYVRLAWEVDLDALISISGASHFSELGTLALPNGEIHAVYRTATNRRQEPVRWEHAWRTTGGAWRTEPLGGWSREPLDNRHSLWDGLGLDTTGVAGRGEGDQYKARLATEGGRSRIVLRFRAPGKGEWEEEVAPLPNSYGRELYAFGAPDGTVHVVATGGNQLLLQHWRRNPATGEWRETPMAEYRRGRRVWLRPLLAADGRVHYLAHTPSGVVHGVVPEPATLSFLVSRRVGDGAWEVVGETVGYTWIDPDPLVGQDVEYAVRPVTPDGLGLPLTTWGRAGPMTAVGWRGRGLAVAVAEEGKASVCWFDRLPPGMGCVSGAQETGWPAWQGLPSDPYWPVAILDLPAHRVLVQDLATGVLMEVVGGEGATKVTESRASFPGGRAAAVGNGHLVAFAREADATLAVAWEKDGKWREEQVGPPGSSTTPGLAVAPEGDPHIVAGLGDMGEVAHYWRMEGGGWETEVVEAGAGLAHEAAAAFAGGTLHAVYTDSASLSLRHARRLEGEWVVERIWEPGHGGAYLDMAVTPDGTIHLVFQDLMKRDLVHGRYLAGEGWSWETLDAEGDTGRYASLAVAADGALHIAFVSGPEDEIRTIRVLP